MTRFGGLPGGLGSLGNMQKLMQQAQKMQQDAARLQDEMKDARYQASSGGGVVTATVDGFGHLVNLEIKAEVCDPEDVQMLQDLILTAVTDAAHTAETDQQERMSAITQELGDLKLPPGLV